MNLTYKNLIRFCLLVTLTCSVINLQGQSISLQGTWIGNGQVNIQANPSGLHQNCQYTVTVTCSCGQELSCITGLNNSACTMTFTGLSSGTHTFTATATRFAGPNGSSCPATLTVTQINVLPVKYSSFNVAFNEKEGAEITFSTESETNCDYFEIERAEEGKEFEAIGWLQGNGNSDSRKNYSFMDKNVSFGRWIYRIKQFDYDGQYYYSDIRELNREPDFGVNIKYFVDSDRLTFTGKSYSSGKFSIVNIEGSVIEEHVFDNSAMDIDLFHLNRGVYFVIFEDAEIKPFRFIKI